MLDLHFGHVSELAAVEAPVVDEDPLPEDPWSRDFSESSSISRPSLAKLSFEKKSPRDAVEGTLADCGEEVLGHDEDFLGVVKELEVVLEEDCFGLIQGREQQAP